MLELLMIRSLVAGDRLPDAPPGLAFRAFQRGDEHVWADIQSSTGQYRSASVELFECQFGTDFDSHSDRIAFVYSDTQPVAVAAAWTPEPSVSKDWGRIHWVAVRPLFQRRGIGAMIVQFCLCQLRDCGYRFAYLTTGATNLSAIRLYRTLGFAPRPRSPEERSTWSVINDSS